MKSTMDVKYDNDGRIHVDWPDGMSQHFVEVKDEMGRVTEIIEETPFTTDKTEEMQIIFFGEAVRMGLEYLNARPDLNEYMMGTGSLPFTLTLTRKG